YARLPGPAIEAGDEESAVRASVRALRDERGDARTVMDVSEVHEPVARTWHTPGADKISLKDAAAHSDYVAKGEQGRAYARQFGVGLDDASAFRVSDVAAQPQGPVFPVAKQPSQLPHKKLIVADAQGTPFEPIGDRDRNLHLREDVGNIHEVTAAMQRGR